jgi:hypothetical protein
MINKNKILSITLLVCTIFISACEPSVKSETGSKYWYDIDSNTDFMMVKNGYIVRTIISYGVFMVFVQGEIPDEWKCVLDRKK